MLVLYCATSMKIGLDAAFHSAAVGWSFEAFGRRLPVFFESVSQRPTVDVDHRMGTH